MFLFSLVCVGLVDKLINQRIYRYKRIPRLLARYTTFLLFTEKYQRIIRNRYGWWCWYINTVFSRQFRPYYFQKSYHFLVIIIMFQWEFLISLYFCLTLFIRILYKHFKGFYNFCTVKWTASSAPDLTPAILFVLEFLPPPRHRPSPAFILANMGESERVTLISINVRDTMLPHV